MYDIENTRRENMMNRCEFETETLDEMSMIYVYNYIQLEILQK